MDFSRLQNLQFDLNTTNATATSLPSTLLELVVPGYSTISQLAFRLLGIDIGVLVGATHEIYLTLLMQHPCCRLLDGHWSSAAIPLGDISTTWYLATSTNTTLLPFRSMMTTPCSTMSRPG